MKELVEKLNLEPHPEGGYYRQCFKSDVIVHPTNKENTRSAMTHIYYLLLKGNYSRFHRNAYDEIWNLYAGDGARLVLFDMDKRTVEEHSLSSNEMRFQLAVPGGIWQAAEPTGDYALFGCTVSPGWEFEDEVYMTDYPDVSRALKELNPAEARMIEQGPNPAR